MKKLSLLSSLLVIVLFMSCVGDPGPQGPPGFDGFDGLDGADGLIGSVFEAEVNFTEANGYEVLVDFPTSIEVFDTDVVMAYVLINIDDGADIWEPLPQTLFIENDILLYGFNHTYFDISFFLDGTIDLNTLGPLYTDNIVFRVAIIPADLYSTIDANNLFEVMGAMEIDNVERY